MSLEEVKDIKKLITRKSAFPPVFQAGRMMTGML